jgi:tRNA threonylcarbamoyladenosine biosynthesis protein TsaE
MKRHFLASEAELPDFCERLFKSQSSPLVVMLSGTLGAGKTTLVRHMAQAIGIQERVTSPSFVLMNVYPPTDSHAVGLIHCDFYRLEGDDGFSLLAELEEHQARFSAWVFVEWAERLPEFAHSADWQIEITEENDQRRYTVQGLSERGKEALVTLEQDGGFST